MRRLGAGCAFAVTVAAAVSSCAPPRSTRADRLPSVFVWAWERPEDLRDLDPRVGVAFLAETLAINGDAVRVTRRRQPLRVATAAVVSAVTRIETAGGIPGLRALDIAANAIAASAIQPQVAAVQIDFDATVSEREFYRTLLARVRERLPHTPLSITALASWCSGDDWLRELPIDEAVPMLFRMGPVNAPFLRLATDARRATPLCRGAIGVSLDEPVEVAPRPARRVYVFNPRPWTHLAMRRALARVVE